jgi:hypothetical protein
MLFAIEKNLSDNQTYNWKNLSHNWIYNLNAEITMQI